MKFALIFFLFACPVAAIAQTNNISDISISPLAIYTSEWNKPVYEKCNTANKALYMSKTERDVIYILNLIRSYPAQFARTVLKDYPDKGLKGWLVNTDYYKSLMDTLLKMKPVNILQPDKNCYISAECHATSSGKTDFIGHERQTNECKKLQHYYGECCDYGNSAALDIVLSLLIDEGVPSLGHRWICLGPYKKLGVSVKPHKSYRQNTVLDFYY